MSDFEAFAAGLREELAPSGILEGMLADLITRTAWDLNIGDDSALRHRRSRSDRLLLRALDTLERVQGRRNLQVEPSAEPSRDRRPGRIPYHIEGLIPAIEEVETPSLPEPTDVEEDRWRDRLVFDPDISDLSPVVRGTWISASYLISLIVDGWSWLDILRAHPELVEADIRACLRFSTEQGETPDDWLLDQPREPGE